MARTEVVDIRVNEDFDISVPLQFVSGTDLVLQRWGIHSRTHRGEWLLDDRHGFPYVDWLEEKSDQSAEIRLAMRRALLATPGVESVRSILIEQDASLNYSGSVSVVLADRTELGLKIESSEDEPVFFVTALTGGSIA